MGLTTTEDRAMAKASKFGKGGCYECIECGRKTRSTGRGDNENCQLCVECYDRCSLENEMSDNGETPETLAEAEALKQAAIAKGGKFTEEPASEPVAPAADQILVNAFNEMLDNRRIAFKQEQDKLIRTAATSPSNAIRYADSVLMAEYEYFILQRVSGKVALFGDAKTLDEIIEDLTGDLIDNVGQGETSSSLSRGVHAAHQKGLKNAIEALKRFRKLRG